MAIRSAKWFSCAKIKFLCAPRFRRRVCSYFGPLLTSFCVWGVLTRRGDAAGYNNITPSVKLTSAGYCIPWHYLDPPNHILRIDSPRPFLLPLRWRHCKGTTRWEWMGCWCSRHSRIAGQSTILCRLKNSVSSRINGYQTWNQKDSLDPRLSEKASSMIVRGNGPHPLTHPTMTNSDRVDMSYYY